MTGGGTAILGGGTDVSVGRGTATFVDGIATVGLVGATMVADAAGAPVTTDADTPPVSETSDEADIVATAGTACDGGGTSYFLAAY